MEALAARGALQVYRPGTVIFDQGDRGTSLHLIQEGLVKLYTSWADGRVALLGVLQPGQLLGEASIFDGAPRPAAAAP